MFGRGKAQKLAELGQAVNDADTGETSGMTVKEWDKLHGRYVRASDDAARHMEEVKVRQWKR